MKRRCISIRPATLSFVAQLSNSHCKALVLSSIDLGGLLSPEPFAGLEAGAVEDDHRMAPNEAADRRAC